MGNLSFQPIKFPGWHTFTPVGWKEPIEILLSKTCKVTRAKIKGQAYYVKAAEYAADGSVVSIATALHVNLVVPQPPKPERPPEPKPEPRLIPIQERFRDETARYDAPIRNWIKTHPRPERLKPLFLQIVEQEDYPGRKPILEFLSALCESDLLHFVYVHSELLNLKYQEYALASWIVELGPSAKNVGELFCKISSDKFYKIFATKENFDGFVNHGIEPPPMAILEEPCKRLTPYVSPWDEFKERIYHNPKDYTSPGFDPHEEPMLIDDDEDDDFDNDQ